MLSEMRWLNEPRDWSVDGDTMCAVTEMKTDFWCQTFYGFTRDNGHFYYQQVSGDFTAQVTLSGDYQTLYDQSGLMLRVDQHNWIKAGIEFTDGAMHLSTVITRGFSDWSVVPLTQFDGKLRLRLTRHETALRVQYLTSDGVWQLLRLGYLDLPEAVQVGIMCCSPERADFSATFADFKVSEPISRDLH